jgi:DNA repair and recombination RAD54-like protein
MRRSVLTSLANGVDPANQNGSPSPRFCSGGGFGVPSFKKIFTPPVSAVKASLRATTLASRKRKRPVANPDDGDDSDDEDGRKRKRKHRFGSESPPRPQKVYPVFKVKPSQETLSKSFQLPEMRDTKGQVIVTRLTNGALGVCRRPSAIPRPLHDPFADHAIVLWDPTIDISEEDKKRQEEEERQKREREAARNQGPHKSLAQILGIAKKDKEQVRVPVVIDPRLTAVLRPHQVDGVKFLYKAATGGIAEGASG